MKKTFFIPIFVFMLTACSALAPQQATSPTSSSTPAPTGLPTPTVTEPPPDTPTSAPTQVPATASPTATADLIPTFSLELTQTPGIMATATAYAAAVTADYLANSVLLGPMADMMGIAQYFNPVGMPLKTWHSVPILAQATAGQEFKADIYSYKAEATLNVAAQFYVAQAGIMKWSCNPQSTGYAGTGSNANHSAALLCQGLMIDITSFDNDTAHVIVVINKAP